jgi:AcrR family transcriptional regulator
MTPVRKTANSPSTRDAIYASAAELFAARGFDGVSMDDVARNAAVNKAMIYYHFADKLTLYRDIVGDGLRMMSDTVGAIAASREAAPIKLDRFIEAFVRMTEQRPWMPAMMLREIAEGAPRLDPPTLGHMRGVVGGFASILKQGQDAGVFRLVHPVLAYESIVGPIIINAARERVSARPGSVHQNFPLLVDIAHDQLIAHNQEAARRMLATDGTEATRAAESADK